MSKFAFDPPVSKATAKYVAGTLEVRAKRDNNMGLSDRKVPAGTIGYVKAQRPADKQVLVHWPYVEKTHKGDWQTSSHDLDDVEPTGRRVPR